MRYLEKIAVKNFGGLTNFSAELGDIAIFCGTNGEGKSSLLNSIRALFEKGGDTTLVKNGTKKAEVSVEFSNGYKATKVITPTGYTLEVFDSHGGKITGPATKLAEFIPKDTFSVQELLDAKPGELAALMLKHLPMNFTAEEVNQALRSPNLKQSISLGEFNALRKTQYDKRTDVNRSVRDLEGTINNMESALSDDDKTDWLHERDRLDFEISGVDTDTIALKQSIDDQKLAFLDEKEKEKDAAVDALRKQIVDLEAKYFQVSTGADKMANEEFAAGRAELDQKRADLVQQRGAASEKANNQQRMIGIRNAIDTEKKRLDGHVTQETLLTQCLEDMDQIKALKLKNLPIDGLDIEMDGKSPIIKIDGIPLERLNAQKQLFTIVKFIDAAQAAIGCEFKVIVCEGAELVPSRLIMLAEACIEAGIQLLITMPVDGTPLRVMDLSAYKTLVGVTA